MNSGKPIGLLRSILTRVLSEAAVRATQMVAMQLELQRDFARSLATNELLVNGIVDTEDRERYLPLLFRSLPPPSGIDASVTLADYRGRTMPLLLLSRVPVGLTM